MTARLRILRAIGDASASVLKSVQSGHSGEADIVELGTTRQKFVDALAEIDTPTHDEERVVAREIAAIDEELVRFCEGRRSELPRQLVQQSAAKKSRSSACRC